MYYNGYYYTLSRKESFNGDDILCEWGIQTSQWDLINCLNPPHSFPCAKPGPGYPMFHVMVYFCVKWEVVIRFVATSGIVDPQVKPKTIKEVFVALC
jgi:hypothetical protein